MNSNTNRTAATTANNEQPWRGVFFRGPQVAKTREGKNVSRWDVYVGDNEAQPKATVYQIFDFRKAEGLAQRMSHDRNLELINEATLAAA